MPERCHSCCFPLLFSLPMLRRLLLLVLLLPPPLLPAPLLATLRPAPLLPAATVVLSDLHSC